MENTGEKKNMPKEDRRGYRPTQGMEKGALLIRRMFHAHTRTITWLWGDKWCRREGEEGGETMGKLKLLRGGEQLSDTVDEGGLVIVLSMPEKGRKRLGGRRRRGGSVPKKGGCVALVLYTQGVEGKKTFSPLPRGGLCVLVWERQLGQGGEVPRFLEGGGRVSLQYSEVNIEISTTQKY